MRYGTPSPEALPRAGEEKGRYCPVCPHVQLNPQGYQLFVRFSCFFFDFLGFLSIFALWSN